MSRLPPSPHPPPEDDRTAPDHTSHQCPRRKNGHATAAPSAPTSLTPERYPSCSARQPRTAQFEHGNQQPTELATTGSTTPVPHARHRTTRQVASNAYYDYHTKKIGRASCRERV